MSAIARRPFAEIWRTAVGFLIEPVDRTACSRVSTDGLVVAVIGLAPGCGTTTVARLLALVLARGSDSDAAVVVSDERPGRRGSLGPGGRLARRLGVTSARGCGRLAVVPADGLRGAVDQSRGRAPVVVDVDYGANWAVAASLAHLCVVIAGADSDSALVALVADELTALGAAPLVALNRVESGSTADVLLPEAALAARLVRAGMRPTGPLWDRGSGLGDLCRLGDGRRQRVALDPAG
ncbi:MAG: hypothetical protein H0U42_08785 [Thermoleophilaceae bacterium]|nr:hypothetical protein [Thermoleophilaceae bacterium]